MNQINAPHSSVKINDQCRYALNVMEKTSEHLFLTGKAGTGKSTLLTFFRGNTQKNVLILAPTGIAALNVQGSTIHSFFKFKHTVTVEAARGMGLRIKKDIAMLRAIDVIIIDEISMVRADLLDCIDAFLKAALSNQRPFGGKQMVFIGDLYQLAPVVARQEKQFFEEVYPSPYFFSSHVFQNKAFTMRFIELEKVYRQQDVRFIEVLNAIRNGTLTDDHLATLNQRVNTQYALRGGDMYLTTTNARAHTINEQQLDTLKKKIIVCQAVVQGDFDQKVAPAESELRLAVGAQVMFLNNESSGAWVNGTVGKVIEFDKQRGAVVVQCYDGDRVFVKPHKWVIYKYAYDEETRKLTQVAKGSFTQYPLKLAWAITIHKSQGKTFDKVIVDLEGGAFADGQVYVGLSRCRTIEGLTLKQPLGRGDIFVNQEVTQFLTTYYSQGQDAALEAKIKQIQHAIHNATALTMEYRRATGEMVAMNIMPAYVGPMFHQGKTYCGVRGYCLIAKEHRVLVLNQVVTVQNAA